MNLIVNCVVLVLHGKVNKDILSINLVAWECISLILRNNLTVSSGKVLALEENLYINLALCNLLISVKFFFLVGTVHGCLVHAFYENKVK